MEEERRKAWLTSIHMVLHCNGDGYVNVCGGCWQSGWVRGWLVFAIPGKGLMVAFQVGFPTGAVVLVFVCEFWDQSLYSSHVCGCVGGGGSLINENPSLKLLGSGADAGF